MGIKLSVQINTDQIDQAIKQRLRQVVDKTAFDIEARAKIAIQTGTKSGRMYGKHQASAPGEAPATDTGNLVNGIFTISAIGQTIRSEVVVSADYGPVLEFGGANLEARPFLGPAIEAERPSFEQGCAQALQRGADGG